MVVINVVFAFVILNIILGISFIEDILVESISNHEAEQPEFGTNDPSLNPNSNLDRSKRLRDGLFEPCNVWIIQNDRLHLVDFNQTDFAMDKIPIIGSSSLNVPIENISSSLLNYKNEEISLYKPYYGVLVEYNLTSFSKFISRIVEVEIEMHLKFDENIMNLKVQDKSIFSTIKSMRGSTLPHPSSEGNNILKSKTLSSSSSNQYQNINFLLVAGYFKEDTEYFNKGSRKRREIHRRMDAGYGSDKKNRHIKQFVPVFHDNVTLSRQNANQYYAKYGITTFKDKLTSIENSYVSELKQHADENSIYLNDNKINIDKYKLSFMYLPHNDTKLYFSSNSKGDVVLPKLHIKAIQTHQEADNDPINDDDTSIEEEKSRSKKIAIITFLLVTMFISFATLAYIIITWYLKDFQNKHY